ncbi:MAG: TIGR04086 family membrane protein [Lachnospiraceae bacterium]|nr:TIGR04086 family membrane protein [Lachnospiraceae bacterium]
MKRSLFQIVKVIVCSVVITMLGVLLLSLLAYKFRMSDKAIKIGIIVIYTMANIVAGFIIGKIKETRKFLWGAITGLVYFIVLTLISVIGTGELYGNGSMAIIAFLSSVIGGTIGGMVS